MVHKCAGKAAIMGRITRLVEASQIVRPVVLVGNLGAKSTTRSVRGAGEQKCERNVHGVGARSQNCYIWMHSHIWTKLGWWGRAQGQM
jgi:hypothetical protein